MANQHTLVIDVKSQLYQTSNGGLFQGKIGDLELISSQYFNEILSGVGLFPGSTLRSRH